MTTFLLVRHAATHANEQQQYSGFHDATVSSTGKKQIEALEKVLAAYKIDAFFASPSMRAVETIQSAAALQHKEIERLDALREINFGDFEGLTFEKISQCWPEEVTKMTRLKAHYSYPNGESLVQSYERTAKKVDEIKAAYSQQTVLICAHAGTIRSILSHLICQSYRMHWHFKIDNASLTIVTVENDFAVIERLNDTHHTQNMV